MKKEETPYIVPKYPHFLAAWNKLETFYFQIFCSKKRKSADQRKTLISVGLGLSVLMPLSTIYLCRQLYWWRKSAKLEKTADLPQVSDKVVFSTQAGIKLTTLVVIGTDCICRSKSPFSIQ